MLFYAAAHYSPGVNLTGSIANANGIYQVGENGTMLIEHLALNLL